MALILIEGCDGAGKTTLATKLAERLGEVTVLHRGPIQDHPYEEYIDPLRSYEPGGGQNIVADRWHLGEMVYGPIFRGKSEINDSMRFVIDEFLAKKGGMLIYTQQSLNVLRHRLTERGDDMVDVDQLQDIVARYEHVLKMNQSLLPIYTVVDPQDHEVDTIITLARQHEENA